MRAIRKPEDAALDYRGGARVSDGREDEDFFMLGDGVEWPVIALESHLDPQEIIDHTNLYVIPAKAGIH